MREIDLDLERQRLKKRYAEMSDGELEKIGSNPRTLAEWATDLLREEMNKRGLEWREQPAIPAIPEMGETTVDQVRLRFALSNTAWAAATCAVPALCILVALSSSA